MSNKIFYSTDLVSILEGGFVNPSIHLNWFMFDGVSFISVPLLEEELRSSIISMNISQYY